MPITMPSEADYAAKKVRYDKAYERGHPLIDDIKYDAFIRRFKKAHPKAKTLKDVGSDEGKGEREPLPIVVGSLDLCRPDEVAKWMEGVEKVAGRQTGWIFEPKFDGVSITLHYQTRKLAKAWSRGKIIDGKSMGFDVTSRVKYAEGIPASLRDVPTIDTDDEYLVRGELIMHRALFNKFYLDKPDDKGKPRKNARNTVAGWVNSDSPKPADIRRCTFIALHLFRKVKGVWRRPSNAHREWVLLTLLGFTSAMNPVRYSEGHYSLRKLVKDGHKGLKSTLPVHEMGGALDGNLIYIDHLPTEKEVLARMDAIHAAVDIRCDGIVIQPLDNKKYQDKGEQVASHPAFMRAIKKDVMDQESFEGKVGEIEWNISQRGLLKPRLILAKAIEMEGVSVNHATCNNAGFVKNWDLRPGRRLKLIRSGDVIPHVTEVFDGSNWVPLKVKRNGKLVEGVGIKDARVDATLPSKCPACNSRLKWTPTKTDLFCSNEECPGTHGQKVVAFFKHLGVDDVAEKTVLHLMQNGLDTIPKIIHGATPQRLVKLEGYQARKAKLVADAIKGALKEVPLAKVMHASGCFSDASTSLGSTRLQAIISRVGEGKIARESATALRTKLVGMPGAGKRIIDLFIDGLEEWRAFFDEIGSVYTPPSGVQSLKGIAICFTGFRSDEMQSYIEKAGGRVAGMSKLVNVLFASTPSSAKCHKADEYGIPIVPQDKAWEWLKDRAGGK